MKSDSDLLLEDYDPSRSPVSYDVMYLPFPYTYGAMFGCYGLIPSFLAMFLFLHLQTQLFPRAESVSRSVVTTSTILYIVYLALDPQVLNTYTAFPRAESDCILRLSATSICPSQTRRETSVRGAGFEATIQSQ